MIGVDSWLEKEGNKVGVAVANTFPILLIGVGGNDLYPTRGTSVVLAYYGDILERLAV